MSTDITVLKQDSKTYKPIPNTRFGFYTKDNIYDIDGNVMLEADSKITTVTTGADGTAKIVEYCAAFMEIPGLLSQQKISAGGICHGSQRMRQ